MRLVKRNLKTIYYQLYEGKVPVVDDEGNETGDLEVSYTDPVAMKVNISPAKGNAQSEIFGTDLSYDKVFVTDDMNCPITENSVLFVDRVPVQEDGELLNTYDYVVKGVAKSLTHISYAISKVEVSPCVSE